MYASRLAALAATGAPAAVHGREECQCRRCDRAPKRETRVRWRLPEGRYSEGLQGRAKVPDLALYGVEHLRDALPDEPVILVAGEKGAADALRECGFLAVGTVTGASGTPGDDAFRPLLGRPARLWPDNDDDGSGRGHGERIVARSVELGHDDVRTVEWADAPPKGDAADFPRTDDELRAPSDALDILGRIEARVGAPGPRLGAAASGVPRAAISM